MSFEVVDSDIIGEGKDLNLFDGFAYLGFQSYRQIWDALR